jgi:hypothetical protein
MGAKMALKMKEYTISFANAQKSEKAIRKYLLDNSDTIRLTEYAWTELEFFKFKLAKYGGEKDEKFKSTLEGLKAFFKRKVVNNTKYNDVRQSKDSRFTHYFYKLTPKLKKILNTETLFWNAMFSKAFYGFEDPTFYNKETKIGCVLTHEPMVFLYLTEKQKKELEKKGVVFD